MPHIYDMRKHNIPDNFTVFRIQSDSDLQFLLKHYSVNKILLKDRHKRKFYFNFFLKIRRSTEINIYLKIESCTVIDTYNSHFYLDL